MTRVLLVGRGAPDRGGIAAFFEALMQGELAETHDLTFMNLAREIAPRGGVLTSTNVVRTAMDALRVFREAPRYDVVHIHSALAPAVTLVRAAILSVAAKLRRRPVVLHAHGGLIAGWLNSGSRRVLARILLGPADVVVPVAESVAAVLVGVASGRVEVIANGVDMTRFDVPDRRARTTPTIMYAGLLTRRKGVLDLAEASRSLRDQGCLHEVVLVGGTPDEGVAEERIVREAIAELEHVKVVGPRPGSDMPRLYQQADIFCLPSWWEAMPLTILEAMASGLPVVATNVGDVNEMVVDGESGYIVPPHDPAVLAAALGELIGDAERRHAMGVAGRRRVAAGFGISETFGSLDLLYRRLGAGA